jgi:hypothetical protein
MEPINLYNINRFFDWATMINIKKEDEDKLIEALDLNTRLNKTKQIGGDHYQESIQPWDVIMSWKLDPWLANVVKYVQRHHRKNGKQDLEKALHYIEYAIEHYDEIKEKFYARRS